MNTVIVPVDFSANSMHAARYAAQLLVGHLNVTLVLYHSYSKSSEAAEAEEALQRLKTELEKDHIIKIELLAHQEDNFLDGLERAVRHRRADMVIMVMASRSELSQVLFESNTLKMVATKACPVLIVPENAPFRAVKNVMLASDFKDALNVTPSVPIKDFLDVFNPKFHIVNVNKDHYISLSENYEKEKQSLQQMFEDYNPEFYFMRLYDVDEALELFAKDRDINLVITIQKDHSFIEKLFSANLAKKLSYKSNIPILVMHQ